MGFRAYGQSDLTRLVNYSLEHSHEIKKAAKQIEEGVYMRREAIGQGLPQVEGSADYSRMGLDVNLPASLYDMVGTEYQPMLKEIANMDALYTTTLGVQVTQLIYSQSYLEGLRASKKTQELYAILKSKTEEEVIEEVANSYYQTLSLYLQLQSVEKSLVNLNETFRIVQLNYTNELITSSDVKRLKVNITNLEVTHRTLQNSIDLQINYIKALAGMPADTVFVIDTAALVQKLILNDRTFSPFSVESIPAFQSLLKQDEVYKQQVKLAQAIYYPTLAAYGQFQYSSYKQDFGVDKLNGMNTIGVQLKVPLFTSGVNYAKVKQKKIQRLSLQDDILKSRDMLTVNYSNAVAEHQSASDLLVVQQENRDLALQVYNQTALQYKEGVASMADLLNVNSDFLQAESSYNQQILKCKLAEVKVLKATGCLKQLTE
ncbi:MAG: TolC family protein [Bacteroidales bacterium]